MPTWPALHPLRHGHHGVGADGLELRGLRGAAVALETSTRPAVPSALLTAQGRTRVGVGRMHVR